MAMKIPAKPKATLRVGKYTDWSWMCLLPGGVVLDSPSRGLWKTSRGALNFARKTLKDLQLYDVWDITEVVEVVNETRVGPVTPIPKAKVKPKTPWKKGPR